MYVKWFILLLGIGFTDCIYFEFLKLPYIYWNPTFEKVI